MSDAGVRTVEWRRLLLDLVLILVVAGAYHGAGWVGLLQRVVVEGAQVTPTWPPTGIALACLLWGGLKIWPGIAVGTYLAIEQLGSFDPEDLVIVAGNTLAPVCAYLLLRRTGFRIELDRLRDGLLLVFLGGLLPMLISATLGVSTLVFTGKLPASDVWGVWAAWWAGDAMGVLLVTPLLLVLPRIRPVSRVTRDPFRAAEAVALGATTAVVTVAATRSGLSLLFLVFPLLIWAAVRFQLPGAAPCALAVSVLSVSAAIDRVGPFAGHTLLEIMVNLQALNGAAALTGLLLAALVTEQNNIRLQIERACEDLVEVVAHLSSGGRPDPGAGGLPARPDQG
ncbi:MASE1 domain-containing protein [Streptomyces sp. NPDC089799]|uniref:MASE1 domain-containing protein n=1 Tax=Streptomyces sp. NPDC089799 TaxID=3155066 RepID=UPI0034166204